VLQSVSTTSVGFDSLALSFALVLGSLTVLVYLVGV
jgi:hypothetical protein